MDVDGDLDILTPYSDLAYTAWYENAGDGRQWTQRRTNILTSNPFTSIAVAYSVVDHNRDGLPDLFGYVDEGNTSSDFTGYFTNTGAQFGVSTASLGISTARERTSVAVLRVDAGHRGKADDGDAVLPGLRFQFSDGTGAALNSTSAAQRFSRFDLCLDITPGTAAPVYEPGVDAVVASVSVGRVTETGGLFLALPSGSAASTFAPGQQRRYFVVATIAAGAAAAPAKSFRVTHVAANNGAQVYDATTFHALSLEPTTNVQTATITPLP